MEGIQLKLFYEMPDYNNEAYRELSRRDKKPKKIYTNGINTKNNTGGTRNIRGSRKSNTNNQ